jgi:hypothetical protein
MICRSDAYVLLTDEGRFLACAGVSKGELGYQLWSVIAPDAPMLRVHRAARRFVGLFANLKLVATSRCDFAAGCRWLEMLGFERAGLLERYGGDSVDHVLYAREPRA